VVPIQAIMNGAPPPASQQGAPMDQMGQPSMMFWQQQQQAVAPAPAAPVPANTETPIPNPVAGAPAPGPSTSV